MVKKIVFIFFIFLPFFLCAQDGKPFSLPSTIVFISSNSNTNVDYQILQAFQARWKERDPLAFILPIPLSPYTFPLTPKASELSIRTITERLNTRVPTLIIAQGDPAFYLALDFRNASFPSSPIIAFDVAVSGSMRETYKDTPGLYVVELSGLGAMNIKLATQLFPKKKRAVLLLYVGEDIALTETIRKAFSQLYPDLVIVAVPNPSQESAELILRINPEESFVIGLNPGWIDSSGRYVSGKDYVRSITDTYKVPMFEHLPSNMDRGITGGVGVTPQRWGQIAAELGLSLVFEGKEPERWIMGKDYARAFADYKEIIRFGSSPKLLPPGTELINQPPPMWIRYQHILQPLLAILLIAVIFFSFRTVEKHREKKLLISANKRLELEVQERTGELRASNEELATMNENLTTAIKRMEQMRDQVLLSAREITLGRFAAGMANGLNSPLNAIRSSNTALKAVIGNKGFCLGLLDMDEEQRSLLLRFFPRLSVNPARSSAGSIPATLEDSLRRAACLNPSAVASDLYEAGFGALADEELADFTGNKGPIVARALYHLMIILRSTEIIDEAVDKAVETIQAVKEYASDEGMDRESEAVNLQGTLERALVIFRNRFPKSITLITDYEELPLVRGSESIYVRIWANLIQNALQAMPSGGCLTIQTRKEDKQAVVTVGDDGEGIDPVIEDRIFEPFVTTRPMAEGMGLALAFCKRAVESVGGEIGYTRKERGTLFYVRLPLGTKG